MAQRGRIVALATVVIPPANTPEKKNTETLIASPRWKYVGPACTINFEWQIGRWNSTFNGITARKYDTGPQQASAELKEFSTNLTAIPLSGLSPGYYDCEIWFKGKFEDLRVIVQNCVKIVAPTTPALTDLRILGLPKSTWIGGSIYITVMFNYVGPATTGQLYAAIGNQQWWGFDEKWDSGWVTTPLSEQTMLASATIPIVGGSPGAYDIYAKISVPGLADVFTPIYLGTITITL